MNMLENGVGRQGDRERDERGDQVDLGAYGLGDDELSGDGLEGDGLSEPVSSGDWLGGDGAGPDGSGQHQLDGDTDRRSSPAATAGSSLPPFRPSLTMERARFALDLPDEPTVTVDVDHVAWRASLYRDSRLVRSADMPVRFSLEAGHLEVEASRYGMRRIHFVAADGSERRLDPAPGTPEHLRAQLDRRHPRLGRALAAGAVVVLVVNLAVLAPQLLELATHLPVWADRFSPFVSPIALPAGVNTLLTVTAGLAGIERALTFRHHRLLDVETDGIDA